MIAQQLSEPALTAHEIIFFSKYPKLTFQHRMEMATFAYKFRVHWIVYKVVQRVQKVLTCADNPGRLNDARQGCRAKEPSERAQIFSTKRHNFVKNRDHVTGMSL